jgi:hypothetical protein
MPYNLDLNRISLNDYQEILQEQNLLPSRRLLLDGLEDNFTRLQSLGINTLAGLLSALSSPAKLEAAADRIGVSAHYLKILKREAGTLKQKPVLLRNFPDMDESLIQSLFAKGIKTSKDYWESPDAGGTLYGLCDLVRINGVGPKAAKLFYDAGYRSAANIARANAETLFQQISAVNADHRYYQGTLGLKDVRFYIFFTRMLEDFSKVNDHS